MKFLAFALALMIASPVHADEVVARYVAFIGQDDLYNSNGQRLSAPWQVLRQDRANFHRFGISQPGDEWDPLFQDANNRAAMEAMVMQGYINPQAARNLVSGGAMVVVTVFGNGGRGNRVDVDVWK